MRVVIVDGFRGTASQAALSEVITGAGQGAAVASLPTSAGGFRSGG
ncbi:MULTISPECIES: hypothetical protein [Actinomadura]|uniref:Uncharacterized protein n=1 Tax=Actinomadura madurae TaxID=1993 RepID=A0A1I5J3H2_9ACTN|nr:hypothetical protein [Actinomadura madurae]SFO67189.1 hypothetical protein SAMN04489713_108275 [Actinomadura madurae]SPT58622.1 Uncharacterised protein [Actinomadura madurae]